VLVRLLRPSFHCLVASTLAEAYRVIWQVKPILVSLELAFPDGDGLTLIRQMQSDLVLRQTLIACVTTSSAIKDKVLAFRLGADDYFVKPLIPAMNYSGRMLLLRQAGHIARLAK
jgi:DNA-binding response OmpR family regulator